MEIKKTFHKKQLAVAIILTAILVGSLTFSATWLYAGGSISNPGTTYGPGDVDGYSFVVFREGLTFYGKNGSTRVLDYSGTNSSQVIQDAIDSTNSSGGGLVLIKQATYSASVTVKSNVLLLLEVGVTGVSYTLDGTGMALLYANGYVILDAPLNMTGNQVLYGLFHAGSVRPANPTEAQWFYDTDDHALFVYNGTAWEDYTTGAGAPGPQGPAGTSMYGDYTYIVYVNGTDYQYRNWTGQLEGTSNNAENLVEDVLGNSSDYDHLHFAEGVYDVNGVIEDQGKNGITITGTWGSIFDGDTKNDLLPTFNLTGVHDWTFDGVAFQAETVGKGSAGFESSSIFLRDCDNITVNRVLFDHVNGYCIRVNCSTPTYVTNLEVTNCHVNDAGHNFVGGAGINNSRIVNNFSFKSGETLDHEHIWLGARDLSTDIGCFNNIVSGNTFRGGSIAINMDEYTTNNGDMVSFNIFSDNNIYVPPNSSQSDYAVIYCNANNNKFVDNTIVDLRTSKSTGVIVLTNDGAGEPREHNQVISNDIFHVSGSGISGWNCGQRGLICSLNTVAGRGGVAYNAIYFNDNTNTDSICIGNVLGGNLDFDDTVGDNEVAHNTVQVPD